MRRSARSSWGTSCGFPRKICSVVPTATIRFPAKETACASGCAGLPVQIFPLTMTSVTVLCADAPQTAKQRTATTGGSRLGRHGSILESNVLNLFFNIERKSFAHAPFQFLDQGYQIGCTAFAIVVNEIRVIRRYLNVASSQALGAYLLQKKGRGDFTFTDQVWRDHRLRSARQIRKKHILEDASCAFHAGRILGVSNRANLRCRFCKRLSVAALQLEFGRENDPVFVVFETAVSIGESALG